MVEVESKVRLCEEVYGSGSMPETWTRESDSELTQLPANPLLLIGTCPGGGPVVHL